MQFIDLDKQQSKIKEELIESVQKVMKHGQYILGPEVDELERCLSSFVGSKHCVTVSSGTDALLMSLMATGIKPGDEVLTTPFTWISTVEVLKLIGAIPVYVDIDKTTFNLDPDKLEKKITSRSKAIMPVNLFGQCADFDKINSIAKKYNLLVFEDAAQSFGAVYRNQNSCSLGTIGCTSFFPSKPLGCYGDGGACFTDDDELFDKLKAIRFHGKKDTFKYLGINGRLDTIQAAILLVKMKLFDEEILLRNRVSKIYNKLIEEKNMSQNDETKVLTTPKIKSYNKSVFAQYTLISSDRETVLGSLKKNDIPFAIHYPQLTNDHPAYYEKIPNLEISRDMTKKVFSIPMHPYLEREEQERIVEALF